MINGKAGNSNNATLVCQVEMIHGFDSATVIVLTVHRLLFQIQICSY